MILKFWNSDMEAWEYRDRVSRVVCRSQCRAKRIPHEGSDLNCGVKVHATEPGTRKELPHELHVDQHAVPATVKESVAVAVNHVLIEFRDYVGAPPKSRAEMSIVIPMDCPTYLLNDEGKTIERL